MKLILIFSLCSAITGYCQNPVIVQKDFKTWTECVKGGAEIIMITTEKNIERPPYGDRSEGWKMWKI